ncbi:MAG TPA: hypothetical protein VFN78_08765 [Ktedonobacterales bacterium]|nr:hypothetical protein [Ktedonobacterales bacterium]
MRDRTRTRMSALAKSRRASPEELREAQKRVKEIDAELRQLELQPETKQGEDREARYERALRLREMRDEFESRFPTRGPRQPNSLMLALVMTVGSFLTCAFCAGGFYFAFTALNYNAGPTGTASLFWSDVQSQNYQDVYLNVLATNLRLQFPQAQFVGDASQADSDYGKVTKVTLVDNSAASKSNVSNATLTYTVTRTKAGKATTYKVKLVLASVNNNWSVTDMGASIYPTEGGAPPINSATPGANTTPSATGTAGP